MENRRKTNEGGWAEGPIEAGQTLGMPLESVIKRYLGKRNAIVTLLRVRAGIGLTEMAKMIGISEKELTIIEKGDDIVPHQIVPKLAKVLAVDLKTLMIALGMLKGTPKRAERLEESQTLSMAAQYSGPELTKEEKIDMQELFETILKQMKKAKGKR